VRTSPAVVDEIKSEGGSAESLTVDTPNSKALATRSRRSPRHGRLDVLVNNAGITRDGLILRMEDRFRRRRTRTSRCLSRPRRRVHDAAEGAWAGGSTSVSSWRCGQRGSRQLRCPAGLIAHRRRQELAGRITATRSCPVHHDGK
jgi:NAD(P)-dependent dehydrogenase (short-subunit alcohol dehydrogenase family)